MRHPGVEPAPMNGIRKLRTALKLDGAKVGLEGVVDCPRGLSFALDRRHLASRAICARTGIESHDRDRAGNRSGGARSRRTVARCKLFAHACRAEKSTREKRCRSAPVSRVLFPVKGGDHSSRPAIARRLVRPNPRDLSGPLTLLFGLAPGGVWHARAVTRAPVGSYPAISPLPFRAVCFLCHFPRITPRRR